MLRETSCCGLREIEYLKDLTANNILNVYNSLYNSDDLEYFEDDCFCSVLFTDNNLSKKGKRLAKYIKRNKLGAIVSTRPKTNPNSGNQIQCWVWNIDKPKLKRWFKTHLK